jgi:hypothetical protein
LLVLQARQHVRNNFLPLLFIQARWRHSRVYCRPFLA